MPAMPMCVASCLAQCHGIALVTPDANTNTLYVMGLRHGVRQCFDRTVV